VVSAIATALVFLVLVVQFRRFGSSVVILGAAPLSLGGAFGLLALTGTDLNVSSAMGLILLVGLVVKNGIVLLDFAELRHKEGLPMYEAILAAARVRLRPILMTTLCTLFGCCRWRSVSAPARSFSGPSHSPSSAGSVSRRS